VDSLRDNQIVGCVPASPIGNKNDLFAFAHTALPSEMGQDGRHGRSRYARPNDVDSRTIRTFSFTL
jgi:hypothetical protein